MTEREHLRRHAAPVIAAEALLEHNINEGQIRNYLMVKWLLSDDEARSAISAAHVLARDPGTRTALPPDTGDG